MKENEKKLYELNATKDKLFTIISHDLKNLFNSILGFSEMLINSADNQDIAKTQRFAKIINDSAGQSYDLLQNLLQWSRMQTGQIKYDPVSVKLHSEINNVIKLIEASINEKNIKINQDVDKELLVFADRQMLEIILRNLVSNAVKYTPEGGSIDIIANRKGEKIEISIQDTGIGMDKEEQAKLFKIEQGFRKDGTNDEKGTGLGLIVCNDLVEKHGGTIQVESELNKGSKFTFILPRR